MVPLTGTFFGALAGAVNGTFWGAVLCPVVISRPIDIVLRRLAVFCLPVALATGVLGFLAIFYSFPRNYDTIAVAAAFVLTTASFIGVCVHARFRLPRKRRAVKRGTCADCGYAATDLPTARCPECGRVLSRFELGLDRGADGAR